ncbi:MAG: PadR family transcriptional regulator [Halovenus sp.]
MQTTDDTTDNSTANNPTDYTRFQLDLLAAIAGFEGRQVTDPPSEDVPHGLALKEIIEQQYDEEIHHGRLYPNLDTLVEDNLVEKSEIDRRTNGYRLTGDGETLLHDRLDWLASQAGFVLSADDAESGGETNWDVLGGDA